MIESVVLIISLLIAIASAIISWYYSKKSKEYADKSINMQEQQYILLQGQTKNQYVNEACEAFRKEGTPFHYINSLPLELDEKETIWQQTFIRYKKRSPKRTFSQENEVTKK
jgi:hypothetical protein